MLEVEGIIRAEPKAPGGTELQLTGLRVLSVVREPLPVLMSKKSVNAQLPVLLNHAAVLNRHPTRRAIFRLAAAATAAFRRCLEEQRFVEVHSPKLVENATEGGANVFALDYFGKPAYLAQSPQFYKQTMVGVFERVFEVGPVFRAEPHDTIRHINQYTSLDVELGFIESHFEVMALLTRVLAAMVEGLKTRCASELALLQPTLPQVPERIPHLHFSEAQELVTRHLGEQECGQPDLSPEGEKWLGAWAEREHGSAFLFVTGYPMRKRPFYTHPDPERPGYSNSFDLLFRGTELVTGGQRLHRYESYLSALEQRGLRRESFEAYLPLWHATPRRLCHWARAVLDPASRAFEHSPGHAVSTRPDAPVTLMYRPLGATRAVTPSGGGPRDRPHQSTR